MLNIKEFSMLILRQNENFLASSKVIRTLGVKMFTFERIWNKLEFYNLIYDLYKQVINLSGNELEIWLIIHIQR